MVSDLNPLLSSSQSVIKFSVEFIPDHNLFLVLLRKRRLEGICSGPTPIRYWA